MDPSTRLYFAYGANMASKTLSRRKVNPIATYPARIVDDSIAISFSHRNAYATLDRNLPASEFDHRLYRSAPYGVLYEITEYDFEKIKEREIGYHVEDVDVAILSEQQDDQCTSSGEIITAQAFFSDSFLKLRRPMPPSHRYKELLVAGCVENDFIRFGGATYVEWLMQIPSVPSNQLYQSSYNDTLAEKATRLFISFLVIATSMYVGIH